MSQKSLFDRYVDGFTKEIKSLSKDEIEQSRNAFGENKLPRPERDPWYKILLDKFNDPLIKILLVAAIISGVIGYGIEGSIIETLGISVAILLVVLIAFYIDISSQKRFDALEALNDKSDVVTFRKSENGFTEVMIIDQTELVVGDVIKLAIGQAVPADVLVVECEDLTIDQSTLTGESFPVEKVVLKKENETNTDGFKDYIAYKSTIVSTGELTGVVIEVGTSTEIGKVNREATLDLDEETPLTTQLNKLSDLITKLAFWVSSILFVSLTAHYFISGGADGKETLIIIKDVIKFAMIAITLVVVAVPEGLPMAVILSLSYSMKQLIKDNNLIKKLHACETMGCVSAIVTDKTGTLTQNKMTVSEVYNCGSNTDLLEPSLFYNNSAIVSHDTVVGNATDVAIMRYIQSSCADHFTDKIKKVKPFNSSDKYMQTIMEDGKVFIKGAFPQILNLTSPSYLTSKGCDFENLCNWIDLQSTKGKRVIVTGYKERESDELYTIIGAVAIIDPLRDGVKESILDCRSAGIEVVMATGDGEATAMYIAEEAGIDKKLVHSRCLPSTKVVITNQLKASKHIVAVIGDGVNDAPAMNTANVGVSVGSGTQIAKEASDVVLLDDSFVSIVKGIRFGRSLYRNIQKFIVFQTTINVMAAVIVFCGQFVGIDVPLTVTQMLWINLIMDTFAALALSTTDNADVMTDKPRKSDEFIITKAMKSDIFLKTALGLAFLIGFMPDSSTDIVGLSKFFTAFVLMQWWFLFSCRVFGSKDSNIFKGLGSSKLFILISLLILVGQYFISAYGGDVFRMEGIDLSIYLQIWFVSSTPFILFEARKLILR